MALPNFADIVGAEIVQEFDLHGGGIDFVPDEELLKVIESTDLVNDASNGSSIPQSNASDVPAPPPATEDHDSSSSDATHHHDQATAFPTLTEADLVDLELAKDEKTTKSSTSWGVKRLKGNSFTQFLRHL